MGRYPERLKLVLRGRRQDRNAAKGLEVVIAKKPHSSQSILQHRFSISSSSRFSGELNAGK